MEVPKQGQSDPCLSFTDIATEMRKISDFWAIFHFHQNCNAIHAIHYCCSGVISVLLLLNLSDSDDPIKVSQDSRDTGGRKSQSRSQSVSLEANIIQSSLLSAAAPLVSTGVASPVEESPRSAQESQGGEESGAYSEDVFPVSLFYWLIIFFCISYPFLTAFFLNNNINYANFHFFFDELKLYFMKILAFVCFHMLWNPVYTFLIKFILLIPLIIIRIVWK